MEATAESTVQVRMGQLLLNLSVPGYFLKRISTGVEMEIPVYLHLQMEGNRVVPLMVGFPDRRDRAFFEKFISVSGIGVKAAVKALAQPPDRIASAIASEDHDYLTTLPGIGRKRARQIVAGLQEHMQKLWGTSGAAAETGGRGEARAVLKQLGIPVAEADRLLSEACSDLSDDATASELVRQAMKIRGAR